MRHRFFWLALTLLYLALRFQNSPGVFTDHGIVLNDTDPYYRLYRIEHIVKGDWTYLLHDVKLSFPTGFDVPWPTGLDHLLALPLKLLRITDRTTIEAFCAIAIPILSLPTLWAVGFVGTQVGGGWVGLLAGLLLATSLPHIHASQVGQIDHHVLEGLITALALALFYRRRRVKSRKNMAALIALLVLGPSLWPHAWIVAAFIFLGAMLDRQLGSKEDFSRVLFLSSILSLVPLSLSTRFGSGTVSLLGFSWWTPLLYAWSSFTLGMLSRPKQTLRSVGAYALAISLPLILKNGSGFFLEATSNAVRTVRAQASTLSVTNEALSPLSLTLREWMKLGFLPLSAAWIWFACQAFRKERWWLVGFAVTPLTLAFFQMRFAYLASPLLCVLTALFIVELPSVWLKNKYARLLSLAGAAALIMVASPHWGLTAVGNTHPFYSAVRDAGRFLKQAKTMPNNLAKDSAITSNWDDGHWLLYDADIPVVAHPFQGAPAIDTLALLCSTDPGELDAFTQKYPVRYLLVETPTPRMRRWFQSLDLPWEEFFQTARSDSGRVLLKPLPRFYDTTAARMFFRSGQDAQGNFPSSWRLVYVSPLPAPDGERSPALKVFERVPGAKLRARTGAKKPWITAEIVTRDGSILFRQQGRLIEKDIWEWTVPYGAVNRGGVMFDGKYVLHHPVNKSQHLEKDVLENDVLQGTAISLKLGAEEYLKSR